MNALYAGSDRRGLSEPQDAQALESWCRRRWRPIWLSMFAYALLGVLLAAFTPDDALGHEWVRRVIGITASVAPVFMDVPAASPIPDVVRVYFGIMWVSMPVVTLVIVGLYVTIPGQCHARPRVIANYRSRLRILLVYAAALVFTVAVFYFGAFTGLYQPEDGKLTRHMYRSRWSLATGATMFNMALCMLAAGLVSIPVTMWHAWAKLPWVSHREH